MSITPNNTDTNPRKNLANAATANELPALPTPGSGPRIFCPACGILVKLPANECPQCQANLRTGEKPEPYVPIWKRGKMKITIILLIVGLPTLAWNIISNQTEEGLLAYLKAHYGLEACTEPKDMWDKFDQDNFERSVRSGYVTWNKDPHSRRVGQDPNGPETPEEANRPEKEKVLASDNRSYFASTLMSEIPSKDLKLTDNWYLLFPGEWDVAYIIGAGTSNEQIIAGEWSFAWINDGQALQDILSVPYRWQDPPKNFQQIHSTSTRLFNPKLHVWEGFHILNSALVFFRAAKSQDGLIVEHYQAGGGPLVVTTFSDFSATSFKASIKESTNNGGSYTPVAEIWAKKRGINIE